MKKQFTGTNVRMVRTGLRLSQPQFATLMGVHRRTIIRWEQGQHYPEVGSRHRLRFLHLWRKHERWLEYLHDQSGTPPRTAAH